MRPVVHFEISGNDDAKLRDFYSTVFGWHIEHNPEMQYGMVDTHGTRGFNGGISGLQPGQQPGVTVYIAVPDLDAALAQVVAKGGSVIQPPMEIPDVVTFALFSDPHGNTVGLVKGEEGPQVSGGDGEPVTWFEIMGRDASIQDFYRDVFDWKIADMAPTPGYGTVGWEEWGFGGGVGTIDGLHEPYVTVYAEVRDVDASAKKVTANGGEIVMGPQDMAEVGIRVVAFKDPEGNLVGAYKQIPAES
jgi:predicted enzyme related to lactoylglutathione lyase